MKITSIWDYEEVMFQYLENDVEIVNQMFEQEFDNGKIYDKWLNRLYQQKILPEKASRMIKLAFIHHRKSIQWQKYKDQKLKPTKPNEDTIKTERGGMGST